MHVTPYVFFYGRCEEALNFYKTALGGTMALMRVADTEMRHQIPAAEHQKIMHATFTAGGLSFHAADGMETKAIDPEAGNISLMISTADRAEADRVFAALSAGGKVKMPLAEAFWGGYFGMFEDRFGIEWMVSA